MKKLFFTAVIIMAALQLFAQDVPTRTRQAPAPAVVPPPVDLREISGVVKDSKGETVIGASVFLKSTQDSLRATTNEDGIFVFRNVKMATFVLTVSGMGLKPITRKYLQNDAVKRVVLDPIVAADESIMLGIATVNGTPSIVYKPDTVEYRASDYKVRANATVDEILKKMEGMEVGNDGSVTFNGQSVPQVKLNGKTFSGGNVAQAIQNLPADIVDKIQIVDDYGDQAARTGVRDGDPTKTLNITTQADKSVGLTSRVTLQGGNDKRYNGQVSIQRINGNQQISLIGQIQQTVTGVPNNGGGGGRGPGGGGGGGGAGNPGTRLVANPSFSYRDQWAPNVQVIGNYAYQVSEVNDKNLSYGQTVTNRGPSDFTRSGTNSTNSNSHTASFQLEWDIDKHNYIQFRPSYTNSSSNGTTTSLSDNVNNYTSGFEHQLNSTLNNSTSSSPSYGMQILYQHIFTKPGRNVSITTNLTKGENNSVRDANNRYRYYANATTNNLLKDSLAHLINRTNNNNPRFRTSITYVEPLSTKSRLEFNGQVDISTNNNVAISDTVLANGQTQQLHRLDNIFNFTLTQYTTSLSYRYTGTKAQLLLGIRAIPLSLDGTKVNQGTGQDVHTSQSYLMIVPVLNFTYSWTRTERFALTYRPSVQNPNFQNIQPFADRTDPNNVIVGNPNLKPAFNHSAELTYNNYIANSKLNFSANVSGTAVTNQVSTNVLQITTPLDPANPTGPKKSINETRYLNVNGSHSVSGSYSISKQLNDRKYNLSLNGSASYGYTNAFSNGVAYHNTSWTFNQRFGPRINPTESIEINPYISYDLKRQFSTTLRSTATNVQTTSLAIDGRMYFFKTLQINYSASKNFISGLTNQTTNPLIINAGLEKEFGAARRFVITLNVFDLLKQNNVVQQTLPSTGGYTNTLSNPNSRYFMAGIRFNFQKWTGRPTRDGINLQRRGDGSFIY
jgi:hypothetical protein